MTNLALSYRDQPVEHVMLGRPVNVKPVRRVIIDESYPRITKHIVTDVPMRYEPPVVAVTSNDTEDVQELQVYPQDIIVKSKISSEPVVRAQQQRQNTALPEEPDTLQIQEQTVTRPRKPR